MYPCSSANTLAAINDPVPGQVSEDESPRRSRAAGRLSKETGSAVLKRLLYLTSRADSKAFGQAASGALLFGVRHASHTDADQACMLLLTHMHKCLVQQCFGRQCWPGVHAASYVCIGARADGQSLGQIVCIALWCLSAAARGPAPPLGCQAMALLFCEVYQDGARWAAGTSRLMKPWLQVVVNALEDYFTKKKSRLGAALMKSMLKERPSMQAAEALLSFHGSARNAFLKAEAVQLLQALLHPRKVWLGQESSWPGLGAQ